MHIPPGYGVNISRFVHPVKFERTGMFIKHVVNVKFFKNIQRRKTKNQFSDLELVSQYTKLKFRNMGAIPTTMKFSN